MAAISKQVYLKLFAALGPQKWWPGDSPFEVMVGAILVQNTSWKNVERAIDNLRQADLLQPLPLLRTPTSRLQQLVRPAGYFRVKVRRLQSLAEYFVSRYQGSIPKMRDAELAVLREELLAVHGVGPETADSILLYALEKPAFVVDAYTRRIWARHGWIEYDANYDQLQRRVKEQLPVDERLYNEFHALLVAVGNRFCRTVPCCQECPLADMLPEEGIVEPG